MTKLKLPHSLSYNSGFQKGFTLVEVLIALAILAISLTAIVKASASDTENTHYLKQKALAHLVAQEAAELIKLKAIVFINNQTEQETKLAGNAWHWSANKQLIAKPGLLKITIDVYYQKRVIVQKNFYILEAKINAS